MGCFSVLIPGSSISDVFGVVSDKAVFIPLEKVFLK